eukprot:15357935-Ditylum_brightwellii.AAC.1
MRFGVGLFRDSTCRTSAVDVVPAANCYCIIGFDGFAPPVAVDPVIGGIDPTVGGAGGGAACGFSGGAFKKGLVAGILGSADVPPDVGGIFGGIPDGNDGGDAAPLCEEGITDGDVVSSVVPDASSLNIGDALGSSMYSGILCCCCPSSIKML